MQVTTDTTAHQFAGEPRHDEHIGRLDVRRTARIIGVLYIVGTVAGILARVAIAPIVGAPDLLGALAEGSARVQLYSAGVAVMGAALAAIPVLAYPILRRHSTRLASGYVVARSGFETAGYVGFALFMPLLAFVGSDLVAAVGTGDVQFGAALLDGHDMIGRGIFTVVFAVGALLFSAVLYRARLVPRWLSGWGLIAAVPVLATSLLTMLGVLAPDAALQDPVNIPIGIQEMVLAVWLIVRGFDTGAALPAAPPAGAARPEPWAPLPKAARP